MWTKFKDQWPGFTFNDIEVRGPRIGKRKVKFQSVIFQVHPPEKYAAFGFLYSDCQHPAQNAAVSMDDLEEWKDLSVKMNGSPDGAINAARNTATRYGGLDRQSV